MINYVDILELMQDWMPIFNFGTERVGALVIRGGACPVPRHLGPVVQSPISTNPGNL